MNQQQRRQLREENKSYPAHLVEVPSVFWPKQNATERRIKVMRSRNFLVQVIDDGDVYRLSINRTEINGVGAWKDGITWDELQRLKREAGYGDVLAIEFYPPEKHVVNVANIRHLFIPLGPGMPKHWKP